MAPKAAKTTKAAAKGDAKGVKGPFAQPRKAAPPKTKPDHMTEEEWTEDKTCCRICTQGRNDRRKKAGVKQSEAQRSAVAVAHVAAMSSGNYLHGSQSSSTSRHSASPSPGTFFAQDMASQTPLSRFSSDWADGDPHGGFNANAMFGVYQRATVDLNRPYAGSPSVPLRRGPLEFGTVPGAGAFCPPAGFTGQVFDGEYDAMMHGGGFVASEMEDGSAVMNDLINSGTAGYTQLGAAWQDAETQEDPQEEEEDEEEEEVDRGNVDEDEGGDAEEPGDEDEEEEGGRTRSGADSRGKKWKPLEDQCLCDAWKEVSIDPVTGANQNSGAYWGRIKKEFDERKLVDKEYKVMKMVRSQKAMGTRWRIIKAAMSVFHGFHANIEARPNIGMDASLMLERAMDTYQAWNKGKAFAFMHCYTKLKRCEKWCQARLHLAKKADSAVDLDAPLATLAGRPIGVKRAKNAIGDAASSEKTAASIEKYIAGVSTSLAARVEKSEERWKTIFEKQDAKIVIDKEKVAVDKEVAAVKKRKEDMKILTADTANYDAASMEAHNYFRDIILQETADRRAAAAAAAEASLAAAAAATAAGASASASASPASTPPSGPASGTASAPTPPSGEEQPQQHHADADNDVVEVAALAT